MVKTVWEQVGRLKRASVGAGGTGQASVGAGGVSQTSVGAGGTAQAGQCGSRQPWLSECLNMQDCSDVCSSGQG